jgi:HEPN domain-containing protein
VATRDELKELAQLRLREAEVLFDAALYDGCVYLCGYVVELALKACICATLAIDGYPDESYFWTHSFDRLKLLAGLQKEITLTQPALAQNWSIATVWKPDWRYQPKGTNDRAKAEEVLEAIKAEPDGVLSFLSRRW